MQSYQYNFQLCFYNRHSLFQRLQNLLYMEEALNHPIEHQTNSVPAQNSRHLVQSFYKEQLDLMMEEKNKQKLTLQKQKQREKQEFNDRLKKSNEIEQLKDLSYKNYYHMLMESQNKHRQQFVPSNRDRDQVKEGFIEKLNNSERMRNLEKEMKLRDKEIKQSYKEELYKQMLEKRNAKSVQKLKTMQQGGDIIRSLSRVGEWESKKKVADQMSYKQSLDKITDQKKQRTRSTNNHYKSRINQFNLDEYKTHNPLSNPMPFNIQNPYILKQMNYGKNQSYLASRANESL